MMTVVLPSVVLEYLSKPERLGPAWALVVALLLPLGFGVYCLAQKRGLNFFSIFGLVAILVTGGLGLLNLSAGWFAAKEAAFPVFLGLAFPLSHFWGKPLVSELLLNPQIINYPLLRATLDTPAKRESFRLLLWRSSWAMAAASIGSAIANSALVIYLLQDAQPGSEAYVQAIGKQKWLGLIIIGAPLVAITFALLLWMLRRLQVLTGLARADLMSHDTPIRRQVG
jgi:hypothetical protein